MTAFINKGCKVGNEMYGDNMYYKIWNTTHEIIEISDITAGLKSCMLNIMFKVHASSVLNPNTTSVRFY